MPGIPGRPAGPGRPRSPGKPGGPGGPEGPDIPRGPGAPAGPSNCCPCSTVAGSPFAPFSPAPGKIWNSVCKDCSAARNLGPMVGPPPSPSSVESTSGVVCSVSVPESNPCETVAFCPIVTVVVMARGVGVRGRWGTVFSVSGMWREVCSRHGRSVRSGVRPIKTKETKEEPGLSLRGIPSSGVSRQR